MEYRILKVRKRFKWEGVELRLVDKEVPYMNDIPLVMIRAVAPNDGVIPVQFSGGDTQKVMAAKTIAFIEQLYTLGKTKEEIIAELTKTLD